MELFTIGNFSGINSKTINFLNEERSYKEVKFQMLETYGWENKIQLVESFEDFKKLLEEDKRIDEAGIKIFNKAFNKIKEEPEVKLIEFGNIYRHSFEYKEDETFKKILETGSDCLVFDYLKLFYWETSEQLKNEALAYYQFLNDYKMGNNIDGSLDYIEHQSYDELIEEFDLKEFKKDIKHYSKFDTETLIDLYNDKYGEELGYKKQPDSTVEDEIEM